jgi:hypothetical protein
MRIGKRGEGCKLVTPSLTHHFASSPWWLVKNRKGCSAANSSPMNISGIIGDSSNRTVAACRPEVGQLMQAFAEGAVADLVVVLQEQHERAGRKVPAGLAAGFAVAVMWP